MDTVTLVSLLLNVFLAGWTLARRSSTEFKLIEDYRKQKKDMWKAIKGGGK